MHNIFSLKEQQSSIPVAIVFEAGPTHNGLESAYKLIDVAVKAGADAIKFQTLDAKRLVPDPNTMFTYRTLVDKKTGESEEVTESLQEILLRRELAPADWRKVSAYCKEQNIKFFSTASNKTDLELLSEIGVDCVKIASGDINYHYFLRQAAQYPWVVQIDTGSSTIAEVEQAVDVLERAGCTKIIINHCPSGYPAHIDSINLNMLTTLKQMFPYPIAFSDHNPGATMDIAAVALGVSMIEKTITLDRSIRSPEHIMSLESDEAKGFVDTIRELEIALGKSRRGMTEKQERDRVVVRRSVMAGVEIKQGTTITQELLDYARPGDGIPAHMDSIVLGRKALRDIQKGAKLNWNDFE